MGEKGHSAPRRFKSRPRAEEGELNVASAFANNGRCIRTHTSFSYDPCSKTHHIEPVGNDILSTQNCDLGCDSSCLAMEHRSGGMPRARQGVPAQFVVAMFYPAMQQWLTRPRWSTG